MSVVRSATHDESRLGNNASIALDSRIVPVILSGGVGTRLWPLSRSNMPKQALTSLAGFEALLRGKRVVVYGQPFYAGWGLTNDRAPLPRRQRRLSLDELVAGALILYPRYIDPLTRLPCSPEILIDRLSAQHLWHGTRLTPLRRLQGMLFSRAKTLAALCAPKRQL